MKAIKQSAGEADDDYDEDDEEANVASEASGPKDAVEDKSKTPPNKPAGYRFKVEFVKKESKPKAKSNPKTNKKPEKAMADPKAQCYGQYLPKDFSKRGKLFRDQAKAQGHSPKVALRMWLESSERASILADLPLNELKRRKFVPKGCCQNPFASGNGNAALGGC